MAKNLPIIIKHKRIQDNEKGAFPLKIVQINDHMVNVIQLGEVAEYVFTKGILYHYMLDARMPLHISYIDHSKSKGIKKIFRITGKR